MFFKMFFVANKKMNESAWKSLRKYAFGKMIELINKQNYIEMNAWLNEYINK